MVIQNNLIEKLTNIFVNYLDDALALHKDLQRTRYGPTYALNLASDIIRAYPDDEIIWQQVQESELLKIIAEMQNKLCGDWEALYQMDLSSMHRGDDNWHKFDSLINENLDDFFYTQGNNSMTQPLVSLAMSRNPKIRKEYMHSLRINNVVPILFKRFTTKTPATKW